MNKNEMKKTLQTAFFAGCMMLGASVFAPENQDTKDRIIRAERQSGNADHNRNYKPDIAEGVRSEGYRQASQSNDAFDRRLENIRARAAAEGRSTTFVEEVGAACAIQ